MNYATAPYGNKKEKTFKDYMEIQFLINHGNYHTNLRLYYKLQAQLKELKTKILAYGISEKFL